MRLRSVCLSIELMLVENGVVMGVAWGCAIGNSMSSITLQPLPRCRDNQTLIVKHHTDSPACPTVFLNIDFTVDTLSVCCRFFFTSSLLAAPASNLLVVVLLHKQLTMFTSHTLLLPLISCTNISC